MALLSFHNFSFVNLVIEVNELVPLVSLHLLYIKLSQNTFHLSNRLQSLRLILPLSNPWINNFLAVINVT